MFDELKIAEDLLKNKKLLYIRCCDMTILAKYFFYKGMKKSDVMKSLIEYCKSQELMRFNDDNDIVIIQKAIANCKNYLLRVPKRFYITISELNKIALLNDFKKERILFVMLCIAKHMRESNIFKNKKQYKEEKLIFNKSNAELFKEARYNDKAFDRSMMMGEIERFGGLMRMMDDDKAMKISNEMLLWDDNSERILTLDTAENCYKLYKAYKDGKIINCECCGVSTIKNSNRQSMCEKCWKEKEANDNRRYARESMRRKRNHVKGLENPLKPL